MNYVDTQTASLNAVGRVRPGVTTQDREMKVKFSEMGALSAFTMTTLTMVGVISLILLALDMSNALFFGFACLGWKM